MVSTLPDTKRPDNHPERDASSHCTGQQASAYNTGGYPASGNRSFDPGFRNKPKLDMEALIPDRLQTGQFYLGIRATLCDAFAFHCVPAQTPAFNQDRLNPGGQQGLRQDTITLGRESYDWEHTLCGRNIEVQQTHRTCFHDSNKPGNHSTPKRHFIRIAR